MNDEREETRNETECRRDCCCPVCSLGRALDGVGTKYSGFFNHLINSQIEVLQAFRFLVDKGISSLEKRKAPEEQKKRPIKVEVE